MDSIDLIFEHEYFLNVTGVSSDLDWYQALSLYKAQYLEKCVAPNREFATHEELLYEVTERSKECILGNWLNSDHPSKFFNLLNYIYTIGTPKENIKLFSSNISKTALHNPIGLENILHFENNLQRYVLEGIESRLGYQLKPTSIEYLEKVLSNSTDPKYAQIIKSSSNIVTNYITHYENGTEHASLLIGLIKKQGVDSNIKSYIFSQFLRDIETATSWRNYHLFDNMATLLPYDDKNHTLARGLFSAQKHGYLASIDQLTDFEQLLDDPFIKEYAVNFIENSLEKLLSDSNDDSNIAIIKEHAQLLFHKAEKLSHSFIRAIFKYYETNQEYFQALILDLIAQDKSLPIDVLDTLSNVLIKIKSPKIALFMATRLAQHNVKIPIGTLKDFTTFLHTEDLGINRLAINLYYELSSAECAGIEAHLVESLITALAKANAEQYIKIRTILDRFTLTETQNLSIKIQNEVFRWNEAKTLEQKNRISDALYDQIRADTARELVPFFQEHLRYQNLVLITKSHSALKKLQDYISISWSDKDRELLAFFDYKIGSSIAKECFDTSAICKDEGNSSCEQEISTNIQDSNYVKITAQNTIFLLTKNQCEELLKDRASLNIKVIVSKIAFSDIRQIISLLEFIKINGLEEHELAQALESRNISVFYTTLLQNLLLNKELLPSEKNALVRSIKYLIDEIEWSADFLFTFINAVEITYYAQLIVVLEKLADYKVSPNMIDREGITALEYLEKFSISALSKINRIIADNHFYIAKEVNSILDELKEKNSHNKKILELIENGYFIDQLKKISSIQKDDITKPLQSWSNDDFLKWRDSIKKVDDNNIAEIIAVMSEAAHRTILHSKSYPRMTQIIAVFALFKSSNGGLAQIATGEGKSLIIATFAMIQVMQGRTIDIVTSSAVLAMRDAAEQYAFYSTFGISVAHNIGSTYMVQTGDTLHSIALKVNVQLQQLKSLNRISDHNLKLTVGSELRLPHKEEEKECYKRNVVYGDLLHFIGDTLRDISANMKFGRGFDLIIVDEVDNMFIDQNEMKVQLSGTMPGMDALGAVLVYMRGTATAVISRLRQEGDECYFKNPVLSNEQQANITGGQITEIEADDQFEEVLLTLNCNEFIKSYIKNYTEYDVLALDQVRENRFVILPKHLEKFAESQLDRWADSMLSSYYHEEKHSYIKYQSAKDSRYQFTVIAPIDYKNTGTIQHTLQWSDGLHQFLQVKHALTMYPENIISIFMSYFGFFSKYKNSIYGVTGTLGKVFHHDFLRDTYNVEISIIPSFIEKDFTEFSTIIVENIDEWELEILDIIERKIEGYRAALIIVETIAQVEFLSTRLLDSLYNSEKVFVYGTGAKHLEYDVKRELQIGEIIIATNLAGRGTDLKISAEVKRNGGLHVIMGIFPASVRVQDQGYGRTARQGEPGSAQSIINTEWITNSTCDPDVHCFNHERNDKEQSKLKKESACKLSLLEVKDRLFGAYVELMKEVDSPTGYKLIIGNQNNLESKSLCLYQEEKSIILKIVSGRDKNIKVHDITAVLSVIDPNIITHIRTVLSVTHSGSSLNKQAYEIIHFIAAINGYTEYPSIEKRVNDELNKLIDEWKLSHDYTVLSSILRDPKTSYFQALIQEDAAFIDLKDDTDTVHAELRKKYLLWIKDRIVYNNQYEIRQITEDWGIWLKKYDDLFNQANTCEKHTKDSLEKYLGEEFTIFRKEIVKRQDAKTFMQNPNYLVLKAWQYFHIHLKQTSNQLRDANSDQGLISYSWNFMTSTISNIIDSFASRISFGGENYAPFEPLNSAIEFLDNAIKLDHIHSWTADNAMSYISLVKNGTSIIYKDQAEQAHQIKQDFCENTANAINKIKEWIIPSLEAQLAFLLTHQLIDYRDDLAVQLIGSIEIYHLIIGAMERNIDTAVRASGEKMIKVARYVPLEEITKDLNITASVLQAANKTSDLFFTAHTGMHSIGKALNFMSKELVLTGITASGGYIFEISTYELENDPSAWFGIVFVAVVGVISIYTGVWFISAFATNTFLTAFGLSLITQGIGDIQYALMSIANNETIDFKHYMQSKGLAIGIALATAGITHFMDKIPLFHGYIQNSLSGIEDTKKLLWMATATQVAHTGASALLGKVAEQFIDSQGIEATAKEMEMIDEITDTYQSLLNRIFATDALNGDKVLQKELYLEIQKVVAKYQNRFNSDSTKFAVGTGAGATQNLARGAKVFSLDWGNIIVNGAKVVLGVIKDKEAMSKIYTGIKGVIENVGKKALLSVKMIEKKLADDFGTIGEKLSLELISQQYIVNGDINLNTCGNLRNMKLSGDLSSYSDTLVNTCEYVSGLLKRDPSKYEAFKSVFINSIVAVRKHIQVEEIAQPIVDIPASEIGNTFGRYVVKEINKWEDKKNEVKNRSKVDEGHKKPEPNNTNSKQNKGKTKDKKYEVKKGDTLSEIAKQNGVQLDKLLEANPQIKDRNLIHAGEKLNIPSGDNISSNTDIITKQKSLERKVAREINKIIGTEKGITQQEVSALKEFVQDITDPLKDAQNENAQTTSQEQSIVDKSVIKSAKIAKSAMDKYAAFAEKYPNLAKYGTRFLGLIPALIRRTPLMYIVSSTLQGELLGALTGEAMEQAIEKSAKKLQHHVKGLEYDDALALIMAGVVAGSFTFQGIGSWKNISSHLKFWKNIKGQNANLGSLKTKAFKLDKFVSKEIDLDLHEASAIKGGIGHTKERHVGASKQQMIKRLESDRNPKAQASTYPDEATAKRAINDVKRIKAQEIKEWYEGADIGKTKEFFVNDLGIETGYGMSKQNPNISPRYGAQIVLKKMPDGSVQLLTSYPI